MTEDDPHFPLPQFRIDPAAIAHLAVPLALLRGNAVIAVSAAARSHLPRLLADPDRPGPPGPAAAWLLQAAAQGEASDPRGTPVLRAQVIARADDPADGSAAGPGVSLCSLAPQSAKAGQTALDSKLAGLLDNARFIAMGELVDALEHRLNQPRASLRNRLAILEAVLKRGETQRAPGVLQEAYRDLQELFDALAAFREELQVKIRQSRKEGDL